MSRGQFLVQYIKSRLSLIIVWLASLAMLMISFGLYHLPMQAVIYPVSLSVLILVVYFLIQQNKAYQRYRFLYSLSSQIQELNVEFEQSEDVNEQMYQQLVLQVQQLSNQQKGIYYEKRNDLMDYYSMWVHQIKTPIASLKLQCENNPNVDLNFISNLNKIEQYVDLVLTYLKLDNDGFDFVFKQTELDDVIKESVRKFGPDFIAKKIRLDYQPVNCKVLTDSKWLTFVLDQILSNAIKYTSQGSVRIFYQDDCLFVQDTGMGISQQDLPRIFEKGFTGYNGRSNKKASGIGLYISKRICQKLAIDLTISSQIDEGTIVSLRFGKENYRHE